MYTHTHTHTYTYMYTNSLPLSLCIYICVSHSVLSDSLQRYRLAQPGFSVHGILQARILEWVAFPFPIQESNLGLLHCRQILYCLSHQEGPLLFQYGAY